MKIKIISDLHCDVNKTLEFGFKELINKVDLTLIAGDTAGGYKQEMLFLDTLQTNKPVVCVGGNHLGYNYLWERDALKPREGTKEDCIDRLRYKYCGENNIHYLENEYIQVKDKVVFGGTMYTDFNLYSSPEIHSEAGERGLNDFKYVYTYDYKNEVFRPVYAADYISWFNAFMGKLTACIKETTGDIIVVSHFAPSVKSISSRYNGRFWSLNPSYASNLEQFILNNPRIKVWVHGHMHDKFDYKVGQCRVICYPYGYYTDHFMDPVEYKGKNIILP